MSTIKPNTMKRPNKPQTNPSGIQTILLTLALVAMASPLLAEGESSSVASKAIDGGIGLGSIIAVVASWSRNKSLVWAIIHGLLGWIYVVYVAFTSEE